MATVNNCPSVLFLDRDGTLNEEVDYLSDPADLRILPGVPRAIRRFNEAGWTIVVVTNQSGLARGYFNEETLTAIHDKLEAELAQQDARFDAIYICPHHPDDHCACRKPKSKLFEQALADLALVDVPCVVVGDKMSDLEAGRAVGCKTILVKTGYGTDLAAHPETLPFAPDAILDDLTAVADTILGPEHQKDATGHS